MSNREVIGIAADVDRLVLEFRLRDFAIIAQTDRGDRVRAIAVVLAKLHRGAYLVGCGPYSCGILPLTVDEVVLGRPPSPLEAIPDSVADYTLNDAVWMLPSKYVVEMMTSTTTAPVALEVPQEGVSLVS